MQQRHSKTARARLRGACALAAFAALAVGAAPAGTATTAQKHFATPEAAVQALVGALAAQEAQGTAELIAILGPKGKPIIDSGDPVADANARERFGEAYAQFHVIQASGDDRAMLDIGDDRWPFPVPIVKDASGWRFDTDAGDDEILSRRIGRNERGAIQSCLAYVDAQGDYYRMDPDKDSLLHYANRLASTPGKRDGLYYETKEGEAPSPLGPLFASAKTEGYALSGKGDPYHGYHYRILTSQGPHAKGGAYDYVVHGELFGGFALVAWPATWGASGVMTFLVNQDGVVYEKDLGPNTEKAVAKIRTFDPDSSWKVVSDDEM